MAQLCQAVLDDNERKHGTIRKPGAMHKARWMSKVLYSIKICLLKNQISVLPKGTITIFHQQEKMKEFVVFVVNVYCNWWLTCQSASFAPWLDLCLYKTLINHQTVNTVISASAVKAFDRHL